MISVTIVNNFIEEPYNALHNILRYCSIDIKINKETDRLILLILHLVLPPYLSLLLLMSCELLYNLSINQRSKVSYVRNLLNNNLPYSVHCTLHCTYNILMLLQYVR